MALGMSQYLANKVFDAIGNNTSLAIAQCYMKLHLADPGAAATTSPATETTRKSVSFAASASGLMSNDVAVSWPTVPAAEDFSHYSMWDASTAGNFLWSGLITAAAVGVGDTFTIAVGDIDLSITLAA